MRVYGSVQDATNEKPLAGAKVELWIGDRRVANLPTDEEGRFEHKEAAQHAGETLIFKISKEGYQSSDRSHKIEGDEVRADIELVPVPIPITEEPVPKPTPPTPPVDWTKIAMAAVVVILVAVIGYVVVSKYLKGPPAEAKRRLNQGITFASLQDWKNALVEFDAAIDAYPQYGTAYANRGIVYMKLGKLNFAEDDMAKAVELSPRDPLAHYNLAVLYSTVGKLDRGILELDKALEYGFDNYDALKSSGPGSDPDLYNLRGHPDYKPTLEKHKVFVD